MSFRLPLVNSAEHFLQPAFLDGLSDFSGPMIPGGAISFEASTTLSPILRNFASKDSRSNTTIFSVMGKPLGRGTAVFIEPKVYVALGENIMTVTIAEFRFDRPIYAESGDVFLEYLRPETIYVKEEVARHDLELEVIVRRGTREATYSLSIPEGARYTVIVERFPLLIEFRPG